LSTYNISYGEKKGQDSKCQFDSRPLKIKNLPYLRAFRGCATYCWKSLDEGYNFAWDLASIKGLHKKLWAFKVLAFQKIWEFWDFQLESHGKNTIWV
jgi:hypothetical protein